MEDYEVVNFGDKPTEKKWCMPKLFKITGIHKIYSWHIGFNGKKIIIIYGYEDGKKVTDKIVPEFTITDKDINSRAYADIKAKYRKKIKKDYTSGDPTSTRHAVNPMLANLYKASMRLKFPIYCQCKLDGIRCLATLFNNKVELCSRSNTSFNHIKHIRKEIKEFLIYLPSECYLDGEFYIHGEKLQKISSMVSKGKEGGELHDEYKKLKYCIFDIDTRDDTTFEYRYDLLIKRYKEYLEDGNSSRYFCIVSCSVIKDKEQIMEFFEESLYLGYEGIMLRKIAGKNPTKRDLNASKYAHHRVNNILKYKNTFDEEGEILDVMDCKGREEGNARFLIRDPRGNEFNLKFDADFEYRSKLYKDKKKLIGKYITYTYSTLSNNGIPLHCHGKIIRDYE